MMARQHRDVVDLHVRPLVLHHAGAARPQRHAVPAPLRLVRAPEAHGHAPRAGDAEAHDADSPAVGAGDQLRFEPLPLRRQGTRAGAGVEDALHPQLPVLILGDVVALRGLGARGPAADELLVIGALGAGDVAGDLARLQRLGAQHDDARLEGPAHRLLSQDLQPLVGPDAPVERLVESLVKVDHGGPAALQAADRRGVLCIGQGDLILCPCLLHSVVVHVCAVQLLAQRAVLQVRDEPIV
mmetsp:Transcript_11067/g.30281  ORF Transcript_11067/g.30281 Transcript_11067/m.30281 type:complete len:241 (+) Transcript_11067:551-1273(+)